MGVLCLPSFFGLKHAIWPYPYAYASRNFHGIMLRCGLNFLVALARSAFVYATKISRGRFSLPGTAPKRFGFLYKETRQTWTPRLDCN